MLWSRDVTHAFCLSKLCARIVLSCQMLVHTVYSSHGHFLTLTDSVQKRDRELNANLTHTHRDSLTFVVLTLLPVLQDQPVKSGKTLQSSPAMHGCIWHHHFWATMEAEEASHRQEDSKSSNGQQYEIGNVMGPDFQTEHRNNISPFK